ncbi:ABC transporter ATP-binding protein [Streptomyces sp. P9-A4]|uniref:ABC transporter ATP-binding protein n=1 Tax=Streptomyces sp. P9-A4 TaxID=3072285 RepID=UPI002FC965F3
MASHSAVLQLNSLGYEIGGRTLMRDLDLTLNAGESVSVMGPSGSGKSTLLSCALGLLKPDRGNVQVAGVDLAGLNRRKLAEHRRSHIGVVFQFGELVPELTPVENVALAALLSGVPRATAYADAARLLDDLGVPRSDAATATLSGGERQRTAVARALVNKPGLILADEPTGALDEANRDSVADLLFSLPKRWECALLTVTHDRDVASRADRTLALTDGKLL